MAFSKRLVTTWLNWSAIARNHVTVFLAQRSVQDIRFLGFGERASRRVYDRPNDARSKFHRVLCRPHPFVCLDTAEGKEVADEAVHTSRFTRHDRQETGRRASSSSRAAPRKGFDEPHQSGERRPQFVAYIGHEIAPHLEGFLHGCPIFERDEDLSPFFRDASRRLRAALCPGALLSSGIGRPFFLSPLMACSTASSSDRLSQHCDVVPSKPMFSPKSARAPALEASHHVRTHSQDSAGIGIASTKVP